MTDSRSLRMTNTLIRCPITVVGPCPTEAQQALGLKPNMLCNRAVRTVRGEPGQVGWYRCPLGHEFFAPIATAEPSKENE